MLTDTGKLWVPPMPAEQSDPGTQSVRIDKAAAKKLQTIAAIKDQMGEKFKPVQFLNALVVGPIEDLYDETVKAFHKYQEQQARKGKK